MSNIDLSIMQDLLDAGYSKTKVAQLVGLHHSAVCRRVDKGELEIYTAYDEYAHNDHLSYNFEWLWEEDMLEEMCNKAFDNYYINISEFFEENFFDIGRYVNKKYESIYKYLRNKDRLILAEFIFKECITCGDSKNLRDFHNRRDVSFGLDSQCRSCVYNRVKYNYKNNLQYHMKVKESSKAYLHRRLSLEHYLPGNMESMDFNNVFKFFEGRCALSGASVNIHWDHVIPLSIGHGGTVIGNMVPLKGELNMSKHAYNIFEWFEANRQRFKLSQEKFDRLISYLAAQNNLTPEEYRGFYDWCFDNPRTVDEIKRDQRHSLVIWREETGRNFELPEWTKTYYTSEECEVIGQ